jgi:hypothetical protein
VGDSVRSMICFEVCDGCECSAWAVLDFIHMSV